MVNNGVFKLLFNLILLRNYPINTHVCMRHTFLIFSELVSAVFNLQRSSEGGEDVPLLTNHTDKNVFFVLPSFKMSDISSLINSFKPFND